MKMIKNLISFIFSYFIDLGVAFTSMIKNNLTRCTKFIKEDHKYVYLGTSILALLTIYLALPYFGELPSKVTFSVLYTVPDTLLIGLLCIDALFLILSACALADKIRLKRKYQKESFFANDKMTKLAKYFSYVVGAIFALVVVDAFILGWIVSSGYRGIHAEKNPTDFLESMFYMTSKSIPSLSMGIETTIQIALVGTLCGFLLGCLLVFMRIQKIDRRDNDFVKLIKTLALKFSTAYINIIRCTPMMVQAFIVYYTVFNFLKGNYPELSATQLGILWPLNVAGMVTVTINSTAYIAEVLRGAVESLDKGQTEAARSLGMSQWKTMTNVIFPQAVKNSIPAIGNEFIVNIKDSSVLRVLGVYDLMYASSTISGNYARVLEVYITTAIIYFVITITLTSCLSILARKLDMPQYRGIPSSN